MSDELIASAPTQSTSTKDYEVLEPGVYPARCIWVCDLGTHDNTWKGEVKQRREVILVWELSDELMEDGRPFTINWQGTNSLSEMSKLYKHLCDWRGKKFTDEELKGFNLFNVLGKQCMVNINAEPSKKNPDRIYNNLQSIMPLPKGMGLTNERHNPEVKFNIAELGNNPASWEDIWPWVQTKILASHEGLRFQETGSAQPPAEAGTDTPF